MALVYTAIAAFLLFLLTAGIAAFKFVSISLDKITSTTMFKERHGQEIYTSVFGWKPKGCTKVVNYKDHVMPQLDCCIWLEINTCPNEVGRILDTGVFTMTKSDHLQLLLQMPEFSEKPPWWNPIELGDTVLVFTYNHSNGDRVQRLFTSADSTRIYYYDLVY